MSLLIWNLNLKVFKDETDIRDDVKLEKKLFKVKSDETDIKC